MSREFHPSVVGSTSVALKSISIAHKRHLQKRPVLGNQAIIGLIQDYA